MAIDKKRTRVERLSAAKEDLDHKYCLMLQAAKQLDELEAEFAVVAGPIQAKITEAVDVLGKCKTSFEIAINMLRLS